MRRLESKVALVTGAASGIGRAVAATFVAEGAVVFLTDIRHDEGLAASEALGSTAFYAPLDVRDEHAWNDTISHIITTCSHLDVVVNNAGITGFGVSFGPQDPEHVSLQSWREVMSTNLDGVFLGCKAALRAMRAAVPFGAGGSIVNISSRAGLVGVPGAAAYAASKAAVRNHTKSVALYCAEQGLPVRCNSVHPASILTPMWEPVLGPAGREREERMKHFVKDTPLRRFGSVDEVAALVLYLASDESTYTTGAEFIVDGGLFAGTSGTPKEHIGK